MIFEYNQIQLNINSDELLTEFNKIENEVDSIEYIDETNMKHMINLQENSILYTEDIIKQLNMIYEIFTMINETNKISVFKLQNEIHLQEKLINMEKYELDNEYNGNINFLSIQSLENSLQNSQDEYKRINTILNNLMDELNQINEIIIITMYKLKLAEQDLKNKKEYIYILKNNDFLNKKDRIKIILQFSKFCKHIYDN
jgi:hypothetical protein